MQVDAHSVVSTTGSRSSGSSSSASSDSSVEEAETAVVEMLLETYFMHVDNTYNKLQVRRCVLARGCASMAVVVCRSRLVETYFMHVDNTHSKPQTAGLVRGCVDWLAWVGVRYD